MSISGCALSSRFSALAYPMSWRVLSLRLFGRRFCGVAGCVAFLQPLPQVLPWLQPSVGRNISRRLPRGFAGALPLLCSVSSQPLSPQPYLTACRRFRCFFGQPYARAKRLALLLPHPSGLVSIEGSGRAGHGGRRASIGLQAWPAKPGEGSWLPFRKLRRLFNLSAGDFFEVRSLKSWRVLDPLPYRRHLPSRARTPRHRARLCGDPPERMNMPGRSFCPTTIMTTPVTISRSNRCQIWIVSPRRAWRQ